MREFFQLAVEAEDLAVEVWRLDPFKGGVHSGDRPFSDRGVFDGALMRGCRDVVVLDDFGSVALLWGQFLLGQQVVSEEPIELPDLVEYGQFCRVS